MGRHIVSKVRELPPGERKIVEIEGRSIGVFNVAGEYYALRNRCPHQSAPLCVGQITGTLLPSSPGEYRWAQEGEILRCPWHGWEFDLKTGQSVYDPFKCRVRAYEVTVEAENGETASGSRNSGNDEEWLEVESYPVSVEQGDVVVHV